MNSQRVIVGFYYQEKEWILDGQTTKVRLIVSSTGQQQIMGVSGFGLVSWFLIQAFLLRKLHLPSLCSSQG